MTLSEILTSWGHCFNSSGEEWKSAGEKMADEDRDSGEVGSGTSEGEFGSGENLEMEPDFSFGDDNELMIW